MESLEMTQQVHFLPLTDENNQNPYGSNEETGKGEKRKLQKRKKNFKAFKEDQTNLFYHLQELMPSLKQILDMIGLIQTLCLQTKWFKKMKRRAAASIKVAQQLPDAQRASVIAQITAQTQLANQKVISGVDTQK